jgi:tRNA A37 methylthiotransferase MiaB
VLKEAEALAKAGVKELLIISQDTSRLWRGFKVSHGVSSTAGR